MQKKLIFLDIDGTLTDFYGRIPLSAKKALNLAKQAGHQLVLCTGRTKSEIPKEVLEMNFDGIIGAAGAYVECHGETVYHHVIESSQLLKMVNFFEQHHITYCLQTGEGVVMTKQNREGFRDCFLRMGLDEETIWRVLAADVILEENSRKRKNVEKAAYYESVLNANVIREALGDYFVVEGASYGTNSVSNGEITCTGVTKATGIEHYVAYVGGHMSATVGIGDGLNDVDMMNKTAVAVAMGNAKTETKAVADYVTDAVDKDGLWKAFEHLQLI
jgi:Cof subfamily protein (haloacid dehalogenase superfamily)